MSNGLQIGAWMGALIVGEPLQDLLPSSIGEGLFKSLERNMPRGTVVAKAPEKQHSPPQCLNGKHKSFGCLSLLTAHGPRVVNHDDPLKLLPLTSVLIKRLEVASKFMNDEPNLLHQCIFFQKQLVRPFFVLVCRQLGCQGS